MAAKFVNLNQHGTLCINLFLLPLYLQKKIKTFSSEADVRMYYLLHRPISTGIRNAWKEYNDITFTSSHNYNLKLILKLSIENNNEDLWNLRNMAPIDRGSET